MTAKRMLRLHLGAHKTASTHLVKLLKANQDSLAAHRTLLLPKPQIRRPLMDAIQNLTNETPAGAAWEDISTQLESAPNIVISEENIIGITSVANPPDGLYPQAPARTTLALQLLQATPETTELFLAIRAPDAFFVSAWCEAERGGSGRYRPTFRRWMGPTRLGQPYWTRFLERLTDALPDYRITVWTYERYIADPAALFPLLLGRQAGSMPDIRSVENVVRPGPSQRALEELQALRERQSGVSHADVERLIAAYPKGPQYPAPDFFTEDERAVLRRGYADDLARLAALPNVTLLA